MIDSGWFATLLVIVCLFVLWLADREKRETKEYVRERVRDLSEQRDAINDQLLDYQKILSQEREAIRKHHVEALAAITSFGRYNLDAGFQALKFQGIIDGRVAARTTQVTVDQRTGQVIATPRKPQREPGEQPPDPNVRMSSIIDEVHEAERDAARILSDDVPWTARDERSDAIEA